uniref:Hypoxia up-regulated protein 1 n=1 Tax=Panagrolaimus davidi TaxID=227884 RepID=A0A914R4X1_9BILA
MTVHVGIYQQALENTIYVSTYNSINYSTNTFKNYKIKENERFDFLIIFEEIYKEFQHNLGCCCIYLGERFDNEYAKECIEFGKAFEFKNIEILNFYGHQYLQAVFNANYKLKESESIWLAEIDGTLIWQKVNGKSKIIFWSPFLPTTKANFHRFQVALDVHKHPNVMFCHPEIKVDYSLTRKYMPKTRVIFCQRFSNLNTALVKARLLANDPEVSNFDFVNVLTFDVSVWYTEKEILSFNEFKELPCQKLVKIVKQENAVYFKINRGKTTDFISLPNYSRFSLIVTFDINQIYTFTFEDLPECDVNLETEISYLNFLNKGNNELHPHEISKKYEFLSKNILSDDTSINAIGISFGAVSCYAAVNRKNGIESIALDNIGQRHLASYVSYDEVNPKCGQIVFDRMRHCANSSVYDLKHFVGKDYDRLKINKTWTFHVVPLEENNFHIQFQSCGKTASKYSEEIVAELFKTIKQKAEENKGRECNAIAITYPYEFNERQIKGIYTAALLGGWKSVHLLPEPFASVFAYSIETPLLSLSTIIVIDVGGGSLKICVLRVVDEEIRILSYSSTVDVSGKVFDEILVKYFEEKLNSVYGIIVNQSKKYKLLSECQRVKENLSFEIEASIDVDDFDVSQDAQIRIKRSEFEDLISVHLFDMKRIIKDIVFKSKADKIDNVLYVGGGCRIPAIKALLKEIFNTSEHFCHSQPVEVNAIGAAYYAYFLNLSTRKIRDAGLHNTAVSNIRQFMLEQPSFIKHVFKNYKF